MWFFINSEPSHVLPTKFSLYEIKSTTCKVMSNVHCIFHWLASLLTRCRGYKILVNISHSFLVHPVTGYFLAGFWVVYLTFKFFCDIYFVFEWMVFKSVLSCIIGRVISYIYLSFLTIMCVSLGSVWLGIWLWACSVPTVIPYPGSSKYHRERNVCISQFYGIGPYLALRPGSQNLGAILVP